jgi:hypothetical protein
MCSRYTHAKDEAKIRLREKIEVIGAIPRANIRPTDLGPVNRPTIRASPKPKGKFTGTSLRPARRTWHYKICEIQIMFCPG